jgi:lipopolysaccharide/colanic/teichoic acid biosynthesis glycosyltransferase
VRTYGATKRAIDLAAASVGLLLLSPVIATVALLVRVTMGRPVLFRQARAGREGVPFELLKFRTMRSAGAGEDGPEFDQARLTPIGRLLRTWSLDELPSLWNVLKGELSLVGPRPLPVRYVPRYSASQARRHEVPPGITGWAQVNGRNLLTWDERLALDVWYADHRSLTLDFRILGATLTNVLGRQGISHEGHATMPEFDGPAAPRP